MKKFLLTIALLQVIVLKSLLAQELVAQAEADTLSTDQLLELSLEDLMQIKVITASKSDESKQKAPAVISVVTAREIERYGAMSVSEVLDRVAGVFKSGIYTVPSSNIVVRGDHTGSFDTHVLLLINGRPFRESLHMGLNRSLYELFPANAIERIEIIKGPGSVLYGTSAYSGVINIITKKVQKNMLAAQARYGSFGTWQSSVTGTAKVKGISIMGAANVIKSDGWDFTARGEKSIIRNQANTADSALRAPQTLPMAQKGLGTMLQIGYKGLQLNGSFSTLTHATAGQVLQGATPVENANRIDRGFVDLGYSHQFSEKYTSSLNLTYNYSKGLAFTPLPEYKDNSTVRVSNDWLAEWTHYLRLSDRVNVTAGVTTNTQTGWATQPSLNSDLTVFDLTTGKNPTPHQQLPRYQETWLSAYGQADYSPWPFLKLVAGGQLNKVTGIAADFVPRLGSIFTISPAWSAKVLYGQAFRSPSFFERGVISIPGIVGNPKLAPETVGTFESQVTYTTKKVELLLTYFRSMQTNLITRSNPKDSLYTTKYRGKIISVTQYINSGELNFEGLELEGKAHLAPGLSTTGSFTYQTSTASSEQVVYGMPEVMAKLGVAYSAPFGLSAGVFHSYFGKGADITRYNESGTPVTKQVNPEVEPFHFLTANVGLDVFKLFKVQKEASLQLNIYAVNLLDADIYYPEITRKNINSSPGRSERAFYGGLQFTF